MRWPASLLIACWLIWGCRSLRPFAGKADGSATYFPQENRQLLLTVIGTLRGEFQCREAKVQVPDARGTCTPEFPPLSPGFPERQAQPVSVECVEFREDDYVQAIALGDPCVDSDGSCRCGVCGG